MISTIEIIGRVYVYHRINIKSNYITIVTNMLSKLMVNFIYPPNIKIERGDLFGAFKNTYF